MDNAKRGAEALSAGRHAEAIEAYSQAIRASPTAPDYYIKRSTAYQRSSPPDFASALSDAENAVLLAQKRAKRELIVQAQLRRAIALFGLERYADSSFVFEIVKRMDPKEKTLGIWENKIKTKLAALGEDDARVKVTVKETPDVVAPKSETVPAKSEEKTVASGTSSSSTAQTSATATPTQTPANKIRHDWYQNADNVYFTLLAKGVPKDKASIDIQERSLSISFPLLNESTYDFSLEPLFASVDVSKSTVSIMSTKVEIVLKKVTSGQKWHSLESSEPVTSSQATDEDSAKPTIPTTVLEHPPTSTTGPSYPTSSRSGPKNWDKLAADLTAKKPRKDDADNDTEPDTNGSNNDSSSSTTKDAAAVNDDDDDYDYEREDGDEVNGFFKKLYAGASPEVRRAMMKSFTESNGTALSTNWAEVGKGKVETQPPEGMEARAWGS